MEFLGLVIIILVIGIPIWALVRTFTVESRLQRDLKTEIKRLEALVLDMKNGKVTNAAATTEKAQAVPPLGSVILSPAPAQTLPMHTVTLTEASSPAASAPAAVHPPVSPKQASLFSKWKAQFQKFSLTVDWEQFTGVKLFAWLGAVALFCGAGFFVKYSIDNNMISPALRLALGALAGIGLVAWSLLVDRKKYRVTSQILASGAVGVLYTVSYATAHIYHYIPGLAGFILLALVSASAFVLSVFLEGVSISALGAIGAFAVPVLISTGESNILVLFGYLALVNLGLFAVVRRLKSAPLFLLGTAGTLILLALAMMNNGTWRTPLAVCGAGMATVSLYSLFLFFMPRPLCREREIRAAGISVFAAAFILMLALLGRHEAYTMALSVFTVTMAVILGYIREEWSSLSVWGSALTFLAALLAAATGNSPYGNSVNLILFFLWGISGGLGPLMIVKKYGLSKLALRWFRIFPLASMLITVLLLVINPASSPAFWPMVLGLDLIGMFLYFLVGSVSGLIAISVITVLNGILWILRLPASTAHLGFYAVLLASGAVLCAGAMLLFKYLPALLPSPFLKAFGGGTVSMHEKKPEWLTASPALGIFILLGTSFLIQSPIQVNPGMATGIFFLVVALFLGFRMTSVPVMITSLFAFVLAQSCWMARAIPGSGLDISMLVWSASLWAASLIVPVLFFRKASSHPALWQGWAIFELVQTLYLLRASNMRYERSASGWIVVGLFLLKLPLIVYLLKSLAGKAERNRVLAVHGAVLLFYASAVAVLLLSREWLGLTLVFEAAGLLWLNRRIEHPGLPLVSSLMAPAGLALLIANLSVLKRAGDFAVLNPAFISLALATAALAASVALAPKKTMRKIAIPFPSFFMWLAAGTGFILVNFFVADAFALRTGSLIIASDIFSNADSLRFACYSLLWTLFGAALWSAGKLPKGLRFAGLILLGAGALRVIIVPYLFPDKSALAFVPLGAFLPLIAVLAVLLILLKKEDTLLPLKIALNVMLAAALLMAAALQAHLLFNGGSDFSFFYAHDMRAAYISAFSWALYGFVLFLWPGKTGSWMRLAGICLALAGLAKTITVPFLYAIPFAQEGLLLSLPNLLFVFYLGSLVFLALKNHGEKWPLALRIGSRAFWGITLGIFAFYALNVEVARLFGETGGAFTLSTSGRFSQQLAYSLGWLVYAMVLLFVGIKWRSVRTRYASLALFVLTSAKIFIMDLWRLASLYRVASFIALAVVLILVSFLYQKFLIRRES